MAISKNFKSSRHGPQPLLIRLSKVAGPATGPVGAAGPHREFHVSRTCRQLYHFNQALFSLHGNVILPDFVATRMFAQRLNETRRALNIPEKVIKAGSLNAMGLIDEILHYLVALYGEHVQPQVFGKALLELDRKLGSAGLKKVLLNFCVDFPSQPVYLGQIPAGEYLLGTYQGVFVREIVLEEILLLWLANVNPAFAPYRELFDDSKLAKDSSYSQLIAALTEFFAQTSPFGPENQDLIAMLRSPALAFPDSLSGQLRYMQEKWGLLLGKFHTRILANMDVIREEEKTFLPGSGPAAVFEVQTQWQGSEEAERFSADREWMPELVLMAKSVHVWLDQLAKKYNRNIASLDQVPDEELDMLSRWGFRGLWLIGVWERSPASRRIKQKCGNPEALASAYSLYNYEIAADLGGEKALQNLKGRAEARGIRLASDMVPNHMGIDSPWVCEHPERFLSSEQCPFPAYTYNGEDISSDTRVSIYLEDHYYDRSDAAVVFKWMDRKSRAVRYIYHGNDGTRMPWNDTAQLNYLKADVREAVIQKIIDVARKFPIIRFDAAMTLTRRHFQRLWFPQPGQGGDIPSRSGQGMGQAQFDRSMPREFWREVVERVAQEAPDTLLLAEAFWLMESYFVSNLGMHRVYNSAFMHFLKDEDNAKFRASLKNVLEFNPEILKRFVNFMNNPDEETALAQFGKSNKYFGVCTLLATLPGLPMFGHGQIEGFREKYGMEYRKAYRDERPDPDLIRRHEQQIFPLLQKRWVFSGIENFLLYDFYSSSGMVDENVIAFSNRSEGERCLVVYHNCFGHSDGWIKVSAAFAKAGGPGKPRALVQQNLAQGLGLTGGPNTFVVFRDLVTQLKYIRNCQQLHDQGLRIELDAYQTHVFLDFREIDDDERASNAHLNIYLQGRGVASLDEARREMSLQPLHQAFQDLCRPELLERLQKIFHQAVRSEAESSLWEELEAKIRHLTAKSSEQTGNAAESVRNADAIINDLADFRQLFSSETPSAPEENAAIAKKYLQQFFLAQPQLEQVFLLWLLTRRLQESGNAPQPSAEGRSQLETWWLDIVLNATLHNLGWPREQSQNALSLIKIVSATENDFPGFARSLAVGPAQIAGSVINYLTLLFSSQSFRDLLKVNTFQDSQFFNQERFEIFNDWLLILILWELGRPRQDEKKDLGRSDEEILNFMKFLPALAAKTEYKLEVFLQKLAGLAGDRP